jgi:hypothetical protein
MQYPLQGAIIGTAMGYFQGPGDPSLGCNVVFIAKEINGVVEGLGHDPLEFFGRVRLFRLCSSLLVLCVFITHKFFFT